MVVQLFFFFLQITFILGYYKKLNIIPCAKQ